MMEMPFHMAASLVSENDASCPRRVMVPVWKLRFPIGQEQMKRFWYVSISRAVGYVVFL